MIPYTIHAAGASRILELDAGASLRYKFWQVIDGEKVPVQFRRAGSKLLSVVSDTVLVYKNPSPHEFHREYMAHNARSLWLGLQPDSDRLLANMLEYVEAI